ncbi:cupin-like domain-containing protein [Dyella sedimenti]|uniref:cupin-like domain-containing protein n=1 Tax=Dyella sedimenti TaxID=2919947 RepID=UPI001FAB0938|nr:cupin-like domain-containing protein [Dyella sedimenti]
MHAGSASLIEMDWDAFDPWRMQDLRHRLADHPLLQPDQLVALGKRFQGSNHLFTFNNQAGADANFDDVARLYPNRRSVADTLQGINEAKAWMLLRHVQADPTYRELIDRVLDPAMPHIERKDPGMYYRAGWIFVASPHTTTPFHIDRNHGLLLQIHGTKKVYVWDAADADVCSELARDCFHSRHELDKVTWHEAFRQRARVFEVGPGMGVYMPITSPHMVETGDEPSITISLTYSTDATRRNAMEHVLHDLLRRKGLHPPAVGAHALFDRLSYAGAAAMIALHGTGSHPPACPSLAHRTAYAVAD